MLTLILPIGGPGSGKTSLCQNIKNGNIPDILQPYIKIEDYFTYSCRDDLYARVRKDNGSNKTRRILYDMFQQWILDLQVKQMEERNVVAYLDSSNAQKGGRSHIINLIQPDRVILINFRLSQEELLFRTMRRSNHPTFPKGKEEQQKIIIKVLAGMEYAQESESSILLQVTKI